MLKDGNIFERIAVLQDALLRQQFIDAVYPFREVTATALDILIPEASVKSRKSLPFKIAKGRLLTNFAARLS